MKKVYAAEGDGADAATTVSDRENRASTWPDRWAKWRPTPGACSKTASRPARNDRFSAHARSERRKADRQGDFFDQHGVGPRQRRAVALRSTRRPPDFSRSNSLPENAATCGPSCGDRRRTRWADAQWLAQVGELTEDMDAGSATRRLVSTGRAIPPAGPVAAGGRDARGPGRSLSGCTVGRRGDGVARAVLRERGSGLAGARQAAARPTGTRPQLTSFDVADRGRRGSPGPRRRIGQADLTDTGPSCSPSPRSASRCRSPIGCAAHPAEAEQFLRTPAAARASTTPGGVCAEGESWLAQPIGEPPKPVIRCVRRPRPNRNSTANWTSPAGNMPRTPCSAACRATNRLRPPR